MVPYILKVLAGTIFSILNARRKHPDVNNPMEDEGTDSEGFAPPKRVSVQGSIQQSLGLRGNWTVIHAEFST